MKRHALHILAAALTVLGSVLPLSLHAQQKQDALYIYRNDGMFNAFFFGDIERIAYSRVDTFGIEQEDYVVQEIYALDSLFRIPISAIDSVAFVTPETKMKADVVCPDKTIANYIVASDSATWIRLSADCPATLLPKTGDKLVIFDESKYLPDGFAGRVTAVTSGADGYTVTTDAVDITDVFEQVVIKAAGGPPPTENEVRRNIFDGTEMGFGSLKPIELPHIKKTFTAKKSQTLFTALDDNFGVSAEPGQSVSIDMQQAATVRVFILIDALGGVSYDSFLRLDLDTHLTLDLTGKLTARLEIPIEKLGLNSKTFNDIQEETLDKLESVDGLFKFKLQMTAGLYLEGSGEVAFRGRCGGKYTGAVNQTYQKWWGRSAVRNSTQVNNFTDDYAEYEFGYGDFTFSRGVFAKLECWLSLFSRNAQGMENEKDKYGFTIGTDQGKRTTLNNPVLATDVPSELFDTRDGTLFDRLDKDNNVREFCFANINGKAFWGKLEPYTPDPLEGTWFNFSYRAVPKLTEFFVEKDNQKGSYKIGLTARDECLFPTPIGFAVFAVQGEGASETGRLTGDWWWENQYVCYAPRHPRSAEIRQYDVWLDPIKDKPQTYKIFPQIKIKYFRDVYTKSLLANQYRTVTVDPAYLELDDDELTVPEEGTTEYVDFETNIHRVNVTAAGEWIKAERFDNSVRIEAQALPEGVRGRQSRVVVIGVNAEGDVLATDTLTVKQGEVDGYAYAGPSELNIPTYGAVTKIDYDFGDFKYVLKDVGESASEWIKTAYSADYTKPNRFRNEIYISVAPNTTGVARQDTIKVYFSNDEETPLDQTLKFDIVVKQEGGTFELNDLRHLFVGEWNHSSVDNLNIEQRKKLIINDDGTYSELTTWHHETYKYTPTYERGTYTITGFTQGPNRIKVNVKLEYDWYADMNDMTKYKHNTKDDWFFEVYPHFMRAWSAYYDKVEGE